MVQLNDIKAKKITLHIGLHKTATSYIQSHIFGKHPSITLIRGWFSHRQLMAADFSKNLVISDESISGRLFNGTYLEDFNTNMEKIKELYKEPRIIFGIRRHDSFLLSVYKQYLHEGGSGNIDYIFDVNDNGIIKHHELFLEKNNGI